jgi:hypothetical protein
MAQSAWRQLKTRYTAYVWSAGCVTVHVGSYLVAGSGLLLVNAIRTPGDLWFWRPLAVWGLVLALHAVVALLAGRAIRLPRPRISLAPLVPVWNRLRAVVAAWSAPQLSIISRPGLIVRDDLPHRLPPPTQPAPPTETWPVRPASSSVAREQTWPEPPPTWSSSWPAPRTAPPPMKPSVRPTGFDTVLNGTRTADPENPNWDQLEVAAASWLASRANDADHTLAQ